MALSPKLAPLAKIFADTGANLVLGFQFSKDYNIKNAINYIHQSIPAARLRLKGDHLEYHTKLPEVTVLPDTFSNITDATIWARNYMYIDVNKNLTSMACNDHQLVLVANHSAFDAGFIKIILDNFGNTSLDNQLFPEMDYIIHEKEIEAAKPAIINMFDKGFHRWTPKLPPDNTKFVHPELLYKDIPTKELKCYNPVKNALSGFLDYQNLATYISASAVENKVLSSIGSYIIVDTRRYLPYKPDFRNSNHVAAVSPNTEVRGSMTLREVAANFRKDMNKRMDENEPFGSMNPVPEGEIKNGIFSIISSFGALKLKKPIEDISIFVQSHEPKSLNIPFTSYSVVTEKKNDTRIMLRYCPNTIGKVEMNQYFSIFEDVIRNVPLSARIGDVVSAMRKKHIYK